MSYKVNQADPGRWLELKRRRERQLARTATPPQPRVRWVKGVPMPLKPKQVNKYIISGPNKNLKPHNRSLGEIVWPHSFVE